MATDMKQWLHAGKRNNIITLITQATTMKTMRKFMIGAFCVLATALTAQAQTTEEDRMLTTAIRYLDVPYAAHTLDQDGPEELILNCDEVDCTTLVEYVLAESLCPIVNGNVSEGAFAQKLQMIRYRNGQIDGYTSRLHYITDWINNGVRNGFLEDVTAEYSDDTQTVEINYMSTHPQKYKQLAHSPENVTKMKQIEQSISGQTVHYLPKDKLPNSGLRWIKNGDIIAITTNIPGLDIEHLGIAFYADGKLTLIHASSNEGKVVASTTALSQMLKDHKTWTGIRVLRMKK